MASDDESQSKNPGLRSDPPDVETKSYYLQQTLLDQMLLVGFQLCLHMHTTNLGFDFRNLNYRFQRTYRIKDPKASLNFYSDVLGMSLLKKWDFPDGKFSLYFMGYEDTASAPKVPDERTLWTLGKKATIVLTHNWGTEDDPKFEGYHNGNSEPRGYGHIGITVDDTYKACKRFESLNVPFVKKPDEGKMKGLAFIKDPDGYWIEIFDCKNIATAAHAAASKIE